LMWSLGKVIQTPEVLRVYISTFWDRPFHCKDNSKLLEIERDDLLSDLRSLPRQSTIRKVNELVKRARMAKVHAFIISHLRDQFGWFRHESTKKRLLDGLLGEFQKVQHKYNLPMGDFPNVNRFREALSHYDIHRFPRLNPKMVELMDQVLSTDIPRLTRQLPSADQKYIAEYKSAIANPFDIKERPSEPWLIDGPTKAKYDNSFHSLTLTADQKCAGVHVKPLMLSSGLAPDVLKSVWALSDIDKDGYLDADEFAVAMFLCDAVRNKQIEELPDELPAALVPPSRRENIMAPPAVAPPPVVPANPATPAQL